MTIDFAVKLGMTIFVMAIGVAVFFIDPDAENMPKWLRDSDLLWPLIGRSDGTLRKSAKPVLWLWFGVFLFLLWSA